MKRNWIRIICVILCAVLLTGMLSVTASAATVGDCGDNLEWYFSTGNGTLTISGSGSMWNYQEKSKPGWSEHYKYIYNNRAGSVIIQPGVTSIGNYAFYSWHILGDASIGHTVTHIGDYAFAHCDLGSVDLPYNLKYIGNGAFYTSGLSGSLVLFYGLSYIGDNAFSWNELTSVVIPDSVSSLGASAFAHNQLTSASLPMSLVAIPNYVFYDNALTSISIPSFVSTIGKGAFKKNALTQITIPNSVRTIDNEAFKENSLTQVTIPDSVVSLGSGVLAENDLLTTASLPAGLTAVPANTFYGCDFLTDITIPGGVTSIGEGAFANCAALPEITIPSGVTSIAAGAFSFCDNLSTITFEGNAPQIGADSFTGVTATAYYPVNNTTWTDDVMQNYGGTITWVPYDSNFSSLKPTVSVAKNTYNSLNVTWSAVEGAKYYEVYRSTSPDSGYVKLGTYNSETFSKVSGSLSTGTKYYYKVRAYRVVDGYKLYSAYSDVVSGTPTLSAPTGVTVSKNSYNTLKVSWNKVAGASYYQVYRSVKGANDWKLLGVYDENTFSMTSRQLSTGTTYEYRVRCYRWANSERQFSGWSTVKSGTPTLSAPTGVKAVTGTTKGTVTVSWNKVDGAAYYQVYRSANGTSDWKLLGVYDEDTLSMTSKALGSGQTYYYRVRCYRWAGGERQFSSWSTIVNAVAK